jgi:hypothetical protein
MNETFFVGDVDEESRRLVRCSFDCLQAAIAMSKPGVMYRELGEAIDKIARPLGFSVVKRYCGHGVHRLFHCAPNVPHYRKNKTPGVMKAGQTFTIEPMINAGVEDSLEWPDNWTAVTVDGKRSAQFEHTLLVTKTGVEVPTAPGADKPGAKAVTGIEWSDALFQRPLPGVAEAEAEAPAAATATAATAAAATTEATPAAADSASADATSGAGGTA